MPTINRTRPLLLLKRIRATVFAKGDKIPAGYHSALQWSKKFKVSREQAMRLLERAATAGIMSKRIFRIGTSNGSLVRTAHFAEK